MKKVRFLAIIVTLAVLLLVQSLTISTEINHQYANDTEAELNDANPLNNIEQENEYPDISDEQLYKYILSEQGWSSWSGVSNPLEGNEYGKRTDSFTNLQMHYDPANTTSNTTAEVFLGEGWEVYEVHADITELTENRTWISNPNFTDESDPWTFTSNNPGIYSDPVQKWEDDGHAVDDDCIYLEIDSRSTSGIWWYDDGDRARVQQTVSIPRGDVVWAGLRFDYWADTLDDTHYGMTGSFMLYVQIEGNYVVQWAFDAIEDEEIWYDSGMLFIDPAWFNLPSDQSVSIEIGLWSKATVGYTPEIGPSAMIDNFELYTKTKAAPSNISLRMNGELVLDEQGFGVGTIIERPTSPWTSNPKLNFTWTPDPVNPDPNRTIIVEFNVDTYILARRIRTLSVYDITPTSYGESFYVANGTSVAYATYHYADIPDGYFNDYFFNKSIPLNRDIISVARPLAPSTNLTSGWTGGEPGDGFLNVSAYEITTEAGRNGYWRIRSNSPNMISNLEIYDPNGKVWSRTASLRAGNETLIRAYVGSDFANSIVNFTIFDSSGAKWNSVNATVDITGYATTTNFTFAGYNASAGTWLIQAITNDVGTNINWTSTGFFKREFNIIHKSEIIIDYPDDAEGTWITNVTYGDLLLIVLNVSDLDSSILIPSGILTLDWILGSDAFDDSGNGQYTKVIDTSLLSGKGQYTMSLEWTRESFDNAEATLVINVNYATELSSPDYPGIEGPVGYNQSFNVFFKNVNGTGIPGATLSCNWTGAFDVYDRGAGQYEFELDTVSTPIGEYLIQINATFDFVDSAEMLLFVEVREVYNSIAYSANQLSIPVGQSDSFTITWINTDNDQPVTGSNNSIICNWTSFHETGEKNYSVIEGQPGVYTVTIFTESDDPLTSENDWIDVNFTIEKPGFQNHTFKIGVKIRSHNTLFILDDPIQQTNYGDNIIILVYYQDTDLSEGITNSTGELNITVVTPEVGNLVLESGPSLLGDGHYNISIPSKQWGSTGWKNLTIYIEWTGTVLKYYSKFINSSVRILGTETDLSLGLAPTATYFLNNFNFTVVYRDIINDTNVPSSNVLYEVTPITEGHSVTQDDFDIGESITTPGTYVFGLNSEELNNTGTFKFRIRFMWEKGIAPFYENQTMTVSLVVLKRPTYVDYTPVQSTPFAEIAEFNFSYVDALSTNRIMNSSKLKITLDEMEVDYTLSYDTILKTFTLSINTSSLGGIGTYYLHLNLNWSGSPFYEIILSSPFSVPVTLRSTQLTHLSFSPGQWGNNLTIEFVYTDLVSGTSTNMTGILSLNSTLTEYYSISPLGSGHYLVELNTSGFPSNGFFSVNASIIYTGSNFASNAIEIFGISILMRATQLGYESPDPASYQTNATFTVFYTDDSTGVGIIGASIDISCDNASLPLQYWTDELTNGEYRIYVNTSTLGEPATYILNVTLSRSGSPFYEPSSRLLNSRVSERTTQILITKTPGEVYFLEDAEFRFKFTDFLTGDFIQISKDNITLTHGPSHIPIDPINYTLTVGPDYYKISFNSTLMNNTHLITGYEIQLKINKSNIIPYYASRSTVTLVKTIERPTQIQFPLIKDTPFMDNITIDFEYIDYLSAEGIEGAMVNILFLNHSSPVYFEEPQIGGLYRIKVPSEQFGNIGTIYFNITVSKIGIPYYASRSAINIPATIRLIQIRILAEAPPAGSIPVGDPHVVNISLSDLDHGNPVISANLDTNWFSLYQREAIIQEIGLGRYNITLNTTGLIAQKYTFSVSAQKANHTSVQIEVSIQPAANKVNIILQRTTYYADWGELVNIRFDVKDSYRNTPLSGMDVTLLWNGSTYLPNDLENGTYSLTLDTTDMSFGNFNPLITVSREFYQTRQASLILIVSKANGQILTEQSFFNIALGASLEFWVYLNDTTSNRPASGQVNASWNDKEITLSSNGPDGYYEFDSTQFNSSSFTVRQVVNMLIRAVSYNYIFLDVSIDITITPIRSNLEIMGGITSLTINYSNPIYLIANYSTTHYGAPVKSANISYSFVGLTGYLVEQPDGTYRSIIDTSSLAVQSNYLRIEARCTNYETKIVNIFVTIQKLITRLIANESSLDEFAGHTVVFLFNYTDIHNDVPIENATVNAAVEWEEGESVSRDIGNGQYEVEVLLNNDIPGRYNVYVEFFKTNYESKEMIVTIYIKKTLAEIIPALGEPRAEIAKNDTGVVPFIVNDTIHNTFLTDLEGLAYWPDVGEQLLISLGNGTYLMNISGYRDFGPIRVEIDFPDERYTILTFVFILEVRPVITSLDPPEVAMDTNPNGRVSFWVSYIDEDHNNLRIMGASIIYGDYIGQGLLLIGNTTLPDSGLYFFEFRVPNELGSYEFNITFMKRGYDTQVLKVTITSVRSQLQVFIEDTFTAIGPLLAILMLLAAAWIQHFSVPTLIRGMNKMIGALKKGKIPAPEKVASRKEIILRIANEELEPVVIVKTLDEVVGETIVIEVPEVEDLLLRLAEITDLGPEEIEAFRADLARMRPSERSGFLREVIAQEEARRAEALAGIEVEPEPVEKVIMEEEPGELEELKERLLKKGMAMEEIEIILEQAKTLSKADLEALLDSLGISLD